MADFHEVTLGTNSAIGRTAERGTRVEVPTFIERVSTASIEDMEPPCLGVGASLGIHSGKPPTTL